MVAAGASQLRHGGLPRRGITGRTKRPGKSTGRVPKDRVGHPWPNFKQRREDVEHFVKIGEREINVMYVGSVRRFVSRPEGKPPQDTVTITMASGQEITGPAEEATTLLYIEKHR